MRVFPDAVFSNGVEEGATEEVFQRSVGHRSDHGGSGCGLFWSCQTAPAPAAANPFFTSPFHTSSNTYTFGQDPSWTADGRVLSNEIDPNGVSQIYVSTLAGATMSCLTCGQPGPNGFPQERPNGDWILFCSFRGQALTFGAPCLGGFGSDLYPCDLTEAI